jgi:acetoin utilization protein AcuC
MSRSVRVPWDDALIAYDFGHDHPLNPLRVDLTIRLARDLGVLSNPVVSVVAPGIATDD